MSWKRRLFFVLEKLKITPSERKAVSILIVIFVILASVNYMMQPRIPFDQDYYSTLRAEFDRRSREIKDREKKLLAQYYPDTIVSEDSISRLSASGSNFVPEESPDKILKININTADYEVLQQLDGIGPTYARRIVEYRKEHGNFARIEDLTQIKGIGEKRLEKLKPFIKLRE